MSVIASRMPRAVSVGGGLAAVAAMLLPHAGENAHGTLDENAVT